MDTIFDVASQKLTDLTEMTRLQCRGTIRLVCGQVGYENPEKVKKSEMIHILREHLAPELRKRGVSEPDNVVEALISGIEEAPELDRAYEAFSRI